MKLNSLFKFQKILSLKNCFLKKIHLKKNKAKNIQKYFTYHKINKMNLSSF